MTGAPHLPPLPAVRQVQDRLQSIFPPQFERRALLVGDLCARAVFVFLYGGFIQGSGRFLRPSHIYLFTDEQAQRTDDDERLAWVASASTFGFRPPGKRWYADTSRETLRDDLIRNRLLVLGVVHRLLNVPTTSSRPIYFLPEHFAALFHPLVTGAALESEIDKWRSAHLDPAVLSRMRLRQAHLVSDAGDVLIDMPDRSRVRIRGGPSSSLMKGIVEQFAPRYFKQAAVLWLSGSDRKTWPQFVETAAAVGLHFSASEELPDLILADLSSESLPRFVFCEIVATDGAVTAQRKKALLRLVEKSSIPVEQVEFLTAFADRDAPAFRKNFGRLAEDTLAWFESEPGLLIRLQRLP